MKVKPIVLNRFLLWWQIFCQIRNSKTPLPPPHPYPPNKIRTLITFHLKRKSFTSSKKYENFFNLSLCSFLEAKGKMKGRFRKTRCMIIHTDLSKVYWNQVSKKKEYPIPGLFLGGCLYSSTVPGLERSYICPLICVCFWCSRGKIQM